MIGNETGHLLECVELYGNLISKSETWHMERGNIAAAWLKISWRKLHSVKCYDKSNMNVLTLGLWEILGWGLNYFDQFIFVKNNATHVVTSTSNIMTSLFDLA